MYVDFKAGEKDYKLRLSTRNIVALEKAIGMNPLSIFGKGEEIPSVTTMVMILWQSMQKFQHGISLEDAYGIFDDYLLNHSMTDFISVILEIYKVSGIISNDNSEKNE
ncbi:MAG: hypothetical protein J6Q96_01220 [Bacteroidales bacterium]|nr:hypothetical protein [Bacteroidales bacterium]